MWVVRLTSAPFDAKKARISYTQSGFLSMRAGRENAVRELSV